jgi:putative YpdA family bacillithiol system oxidoreductase
MACGIEASRAGLRYLILEKGCLVNSIYRYPANMTFFSTADRLEIGNIPFISHGDKPTRREALDYYRRVAAEWQLKLALYEQVKTVMPIANTTRASLFRIDTSKNTYYCHKLVIATGFYDKPNMLHIPGEDLEKVHHYYNEPHPYAFMDIAIVGAANSAVDAALETYRKGARVTMIIRDDKIRPSVKYWVRPDIENRIAEGSIKALFNTELTAITPHEIEVHGPEGTLRLKNDFVLAMTGYQPDFSLLQHIGIHLADTPEMTPSYDPQWQESNVKGVYLAGVVCGGMKTNQWFIENSRIHAAKIINHIVQQRTEK